MSKDRDQLQSEYAAAPAGRGLGRELPLACAAPRAWQTPAMYLMSLFLLHGTPSVQARERIAPHGQKSPPPPPPPPGRITADPPEITTRQLFTVYALSVIYLLKVRLFGLPR